MRALFHRCERSSGSFQKHLSAIQNQVLPATLQCFGLVKSRRQIPGRGWGMQPSGALLKNFVAPLRVCGM